MGLTDEEVLALISILSRYKWIDFKDRLVGNDVLVRAGCPSIVLQGLRGHYAQALDDLLAKIDGESTIEEIIESLPYDKNALIFLITKLVDAGCLKLIA